jgi:hypothetical protein
MKLPLILKHPDYIRERETGFSRADHCDITPVRSIPGADNHGINDPQGTSPFRHSLQLNTEYRRYMKFLSSLGKHLDFF